MRRWFAPQMLIGVLFATAATAQQTAAQKDLPYVAVHDPQFISAKDATFMNGDDRVIGLMNGEVPKAYPAGILWQHGLVEDKSPEGPIAITWCGYCNTALVFRAEAKGKPLVLDAGGLAGGNEVFKDQETGSRWQQAGLVAISGSLQGEHLQLYPFLLTSWAEWLRLHPDTLVLKPLPGCAERMRAVNKFLKQGGFGASPVPDGVMYPRRPAETESDGGWSRRGWREQSLPPRSAASCAYHQRLARWHAAGDRAPAKHGHHNRVCRQGRRPQADLRRLECGCDRTYRSRNQIRLECVRSVRRRPAEGIET